MTLVLPEGVAPAPPPPGSRQLGLRMSPSLRLSIGFRNPERNMAPDKLDYFRAKEGANQEFAAAARKFHSEDLGYGPTPRAIDIRLPARLEDALRIEYLAFKGSRDDPAGGVMVARGDTNFAALGYCGGPDTLTVFEQDGEVKHVHTKGIDAITKQPLDTVAANSGLMLCTTLRVGLPKILGYGSFAEITSKSLKSTDQLWAKLRDWYAAFPNGTITFAMQPKLVVKPAYARPLVKGKRIRVMVYVLDLVGADSEEEMIARLERYHGSIQITSGSVMPTVAGELPSSEPVGVVPFDAVEDITDAEIVEDAGGDHGAQGDPETGDLPPDETVAAPHVLGPDSDAAEVPTEGTGPIDLDMIPPGGVVSGQESEQLGLTPQPAASDTGDDEEPVLAAVAPAPVAEPTADEMAAAEAAAKVRPPFGSYQTQTLGVILKNPSGNGRLWIEYALKRCVAGKEPNATFERALWAFCRVYLPDLYDEHKESAK